MLKISSVFWQNPAMIQGMIWGAVGFWRKEGTCVSNTFSIEVPMVAHRSHPGVAALSIQRRQRRIVQAVNAAETVSEPLCMDLGLV